MNGTYGQVVSLAEVIEVRVAVTNRRGQVRRRPDEVRWLRGARLKYGPEVEIVDISPNGILIRSHREFSANDTVVLELRAMTGTFLFVRRSAPVLSTSRLAIRIFSTVPRTRVASSNGVRREFPGVTYDVTIKIEHLLKHADLIPLLRDTGCLFVTSAVESIDDEVLEKLEKGHTRSDFVRAVALCREARLTLSPTFIPFTPWTTLEGYVELLGRADSRPRARRAGRADPARHPAARDRGISRCWTFQTSAKRSRHSTRRR